MEWRIHASVEACSWGGEGSAAPGAVEAERSGREGLGHARQQRGRKMRFGRRSERATAELARPISASHCRENNGSHVGAEKARTVTGGCAA